MKNQDMIVDPYFRRFIDKAYLFYQILNLLFAMFVSIGYFAMFTYMNKEGVAVSLMFLVFVIFISVLIKSRYFKIHRAVLHKEFSIVKTIIYYCVGTALFILITLMSISLSGIDLLSLLVFKQGEGVPIDDLLNILGMAEFIIIAACALLSMFVVIGEEFIRTIYNTGLVYRIKSEKHKKNLALVLFTVFVLISSTFVFTVFGDRIYKYSLKLLGDIDSLEFLLLIILEIYYLKVLVGRSELVEEPKTVFIRGRTLS